MYLSNVSPIILITFLAISFFSVFLLFKKYSEKNPSQRGEKLGMDINEAMKNCDEQNEREKPTKTKIDEAIKKLEDL